MPYKHNLCKLLLLLSFSAPLLSNSQTTKESITTTFENYFETERENIHVQLDKNIFMTSEAIWFKGYVYNKKLGLPFYATTNVQVQLLDESGNIVTTQLLYAMSGLFSGKISLGKEFKSGYYYLQFYTNWMNNFPEDESYVQRIKVINPVKNDIPVTERINPKKINAQFYPEGGNLITGIPGEVAVRITDTNGKAIPDCTLEIRDQNNAIQTTVTTNAFGMAKFKYTPTEGNYKVTLVYEGSGFEYSLPTGKPDGIALEINNYVFENKTLIKIKYNKGFAKSQKDNTFFLVIQKNEKSNIVDFKLDPETPSKDFSLPNTSLFPGVNSIRIIDGNNNEIAQRLVFFPEEKKSRVSINTGLKTENGIDLSGSSNWKEACVSIATLPSETRLQVDENIITSFTLNAYLLEKLQVRSSYFEQMSRAKKHELDLMMLTQKENKYDWNRIRVKPSKPLYTFEKGLDVKGTISSSTADLKKCRLQLKNTLGEVISSTEVVTKEGFLLKETPVTDSLMVYCDLIDAKDRSKKDMSYYLTILNKHKKYNQNFVPVPFVYPEKTGTDDFTDLPYFDGIVLSEVEIKKEKPKLTRQNQGSNTMLRGYKVGIDVAEQIRILDFISQNGFNVGSNSDNMVTITGRQIVSLNGQKYTTPMVYMDGRQLLFFDELSGMRLDELDEIYISSTQIIPGMNNNQGLIKMYRKIPALSPFEEKYKPRRLIGGFEPIQTFENADYISQDSAGFRNIGLIFWSPWVLSDEKGNLRITIPNSDHNKVKLQIEGFTFDGAIISETKEVNLKE